MSEPPALHVVAIALQPREHDLARDAIVERADSRRNGTRRRRRARSRAWNERKRNAVDLGVFRLEHARVVRRVAHSPEASTDDLLADKLRAKRADPQTVR